MKIELKPEDEQLIQKRLQSGAFHTIEEVIHDALTSQDAEEDWLQENREAINAKIANGLAQLNSRQGVSGDVARAEPVPCVCAGRRLVACEDGLCVVRRRCGGRVRRRSRDKPQQ